MYFLTVKATAVEFLNQYCHVSTEFQIALINIPYPFAYDITTIICVCLTCFLITGLYMWFEEETFGIKLKAERKKSRFNHGQRGSVSVSFFNTPDDFFKSPQFQDAMSDCDGSQNLASNVAIVDSSHQDVTLNNPTSPKVNGFLSATNLSFNTESESDYSQDEDSALLEDAKYAEFDEEEPSEAAPVLRKGDVSISLSSLNDLLRQ